MPQPGRYLLDRGTAVLRQAATTCATQIVQSHMLGDLGASARADHGSSWLSPDCSGFRPFCGTCDPDGSRSPVRNAPQLRHFRDLLFWVHNQYQCPPIYITENGAYFDDSLSDDGKVRDTRRVEFLNGYINAMLEARSGGVDIRGYFIWTLLDNFEWAAGYRPTFGLVKIDSSLKRTRKDSYYWYRDFIKDHP